MPPCSLWSACSVPPRVKWRRAVNRASMRPPARRTVTSQTLSARGSVRRRTDRRRSEKPEGAHRQRVPASRTTPRSHRDAARTRTGSHSIRPCTRAHPVLRDTPRPSPTVAPGPRPATPPRQTGRGLPPRSPQPPLPRRRSGWTAGQPIGVPVAHADLKPIEHPGTLSEYGPAWFRSYDWVRVSGRRRATPEREQNLTSTARRTPFGTNLERGAPARLRGRWLQGQLPCVDAYLATGAR